MVLTSVPIICSKAKHVKVIQYNAKLNKLDGYAQMVSQQKKKRKTPIRFDTVNKILIHTLNCTIPKRRTNCGAFLQFTRENLTIYNFIHIQYIH